MENTNNNELYHHGVLGMRWGVRKDVRVARRELRIANKDAQKALQKSTVDYNEKKTLADQKRKNYMDAINRKEEWESKLSRGEKFADRSMRVIGTVGVSAAAGVAGYKAYKGATKVIGGLAFGALVLHSIGQAAGK